MSTKEPAHDESELEPEDALLRALGAHARVQESEDAMGEEALAPIEGAEAAALFDAVLAITGKAQSRPGVDAFAEDDGGVLPSPAGLTAPSGRRRWLMALAAAFLVAGVGTAVLLRGGTPSLPDYGLASGAGDQTMRADPAPVRERARYSRGSRVHLIARPAQDVAEKLQVAVFARVGGTTTRLEAPVQVSATGAVRLDAVAGESLKLPVGEGDLILLVRPAGLDATDEALLDAPDPAPARRLAHPFGYSP